MRFINHLFLQYGVIHVVIKDMIVSLYGQDAMDNILWVLVF